MPERPKAQEVFQQPAGNRLKKRRLQNEINAPALVASDNYLFY
jgi:hypothetical protein